MRLIEDCKEAIEKDVVKDRKPRITLVVKGKWGKTGKKKLFPLPKSPVGNIFAECGSNKLLVSFDAKEVLAYCEQLVPVMLSIEEQRRAKGGTDESH
ncbi:MAG: hypothetical protein IM526_02570 [Microcystis sp. M38BS1]|uniref:hypothetical protein n=1 Tax=Microcystis sp. M38BS1 TaxID=2771188 RepID=UPI0031FBC8DB|nr:hypothetical protein [Microcystis sp. M38BS1]MCA6582543.1 hypothetical protein [Pseudanabaena sp. M34BS1SP1A06MG]